MELTVLGGSGLWPRAGQACSGYLLAHDDVRLLIDPGYGVMVELLRYCDAVDVDAVLISHGDLDHCADLGPLLRARILGAGTGAAELADRPVEPLPVVAPEKALDGLLALDPVGLADGAELHRPIGAKIKFGPLAVESAELGRRPAGYGFRITDPDGAVFVYTGDSADSPERIEFARDAGLLLAEVTYPDGVPDRYAEQFSDASQVGRLALEADVDHCVITHLHPAADPILALSLVRRTGFDTVEYARPGLVREIRLRPAATGLPRRAAPKVITMTPSQPRRAATS